MLIVIAAAVGVCCATVFSADTDFFGLPVTPKPATPKPGAPKSGMPGTPPPVVKTGPLTAEDEIAAAVQRFKEASARQDASEIKLAAPALAAYVKELEKIRDTAQAKGQLDAVTEAEAAVKAAQADDLPPPGKLLAPAFAQARTNYERARGAALHPYAGVRARLNADYDRQIDELIQKFIRTGNLDAVQKAREARRILLTVDALVDGSSTLNVRKDGLYWVNGQYAKPGPTYVDGKKWEARWGKPNQPRGVDKTDIRAISLPSLELKVELVSVTERQGEKGLDERDPIEIKHRGNEIQITIPDYDSGGRWYKLVFREIGNGR